MIDSLKRPVPLCVEKYLGRPDARVKNWLFLNSVLWLITILLLYFFTIFVLGKFMKRRSPFNLRKLLIVYNCFQVLYSAHICKEVLVSAYLAGYKLSCTDYDPRPTQLNMRMATAFWHFYFTKIIDLSDTIFFVLRKKKTQLSFLHVYHHSTMIFNWYLGTLYLPGGQAFFSVLCNSMVHVIMYTYYLLSAIGIHKYLWWKKYLTQIQLTQFLVVMGHILLGYRKGCKAPFWLTWFTVTYLCTLVILFCNFYRKTYKEKKSDVLNRMMNYKQAGDFKFD